MAVSYLSQPLRQNPYIPGIDLGLMEKVLSIKQKQFDINHERIQNDINQAGMLDVMKGEDKDYLNSKISNLVNNVNSYGGLDLSDTAVVNKIEGLGSDIYTDDRILNAVASTKGVRNLINTYQQYKNNPKLNKLYSEVNEAVDMRKVNEWLNDGQVGSTYHGPSSATPYVPYRDNHLKAFEKLKGDLKVELKDNGLYWSKTTTEFITPQRIMSMAADLLTPNERAQMKRDAWYLYNVQSPQSPQSLVEKATQQYLQSVNDNEHILQQYQDQAKASVNDPQAQANYTLLANKQKDYLDNLKAQQKAVVGNATKQLTEDPDEFMYQVYSQDYFRGLGNRFSMSRVDRSVQADQAEMFNLKMKQSQAFHEDDVKLRQRQLDIAEEKNAIDMFGKMYKHVDPKTGQVQYMPFGSDTGLTSSGINTEDPDNLEVTEKTIAESNTNLKMQKDNIHRAFIDKLIAQRPDLGITQQTTSGTGIQRILKGQQFLEGLNSEPGFQITDLRDIEKVRGKLIESGLTNEHINFLKTVYNNYDAMLNGKGEDVADLPKGFYEEVVRPSVMLDERVKANEEKLGAIRNLVYEKANLTPDEKKTLDDYAKNPDIYKFGLLTGFFGNDPNYDTKRINAKKLAGIKRKMEDAGVDYDKEMKGYLNQLSTRDVFRTHTFFDNDPLIKSGNIQNYIMSEIANKRVKDVDAEGISVESIKPLNVGIEPGTGAYYIQAQVSTGTGDSKEFPIVKIPLSSDNASKLGINKDAYENLNYSVNLLGRSSDIPVYGNKNMSVTVQVVRKNSGDLNSYDSFAQAKFYFLDSQGRRTGQYQLIDIPATDGQTPSAAFALAERAVQLAAQKGVTFEDFKNYLYNYK